MENEVDHRNQPVQGIFSQALEDYMESEFSRTSAAIENGDGEATLIHFKKATTAALRHLMLNHTSSFLSEEENLEFLKLQAEKIIITNDGDIIKKHFKKGHAKRYRELLIKALIGS